MKNNRGVLLLLAAVLALGAYAYFGEYKREINHSKEKELSLQILNFPLDQIQKVKVVTKGEELELEKTINGWNVNSPYKDQADSEQLDQMLEQLKNEKIVDRIPLKEGFDLNEYGLKNPAGKIIFYNNKGDSQAITISSRKNFENLQYIQINDQGDVLTSGDSWFSFLGKSASSFRDLRLFRFGISKVESLRLKNSKGDFQIINKEAQWVPDLGNWKLDQNEIRSLLLQLTQAKGTELLENKAAGRFLKRIELKIENKIWSADFYLENSTKNLLVNISEPAMSLKFSPQTLEKMKDITLQDLRDKTLSFDFDKSQVVKIEWETPLKKQAILKENGVWKQDPLDPNFQVDPKAGDVLIDKIRSLKVYRFVKAQPTQIKLVNKIKLKNIKNEVVFEFSWSEFNEFEAWSKTTVSDEIFQMDDSQISRLGLTEILQTKPPKGSDAKN